ncbi:MAG: glycosyltransferase family 2 protein [Chitinophagaceae bacterium]|nr:glycosyltransferase family 2 protein [Chitinophagaceae bacterium]
MVISTYNWHQALELCIKSALAQKKLPGEILIADDGSGEETRELIAFFRQRSPVPIQHIWHEDRGFRLAAIRNKAIAKAKGDYIIQVDGDIIMHPYFITDHLDFARKKTFVRASRIYLDEATSADFIRSGKTLVNVWSKGVINKTSALRMPFLWKLFETSYKNKGDERFEIHGCNMAFWKEDALLVNGYNEEFSGWGPEDKEFVARLLNAGIKKRFLKLGGIAFHIYHRENSRSNLHNNEQLLRQSVASNIKFCKTGINQYIEQ